VRLWDSVKETQITAMPVCSFMLEFQEEHWVVGCDMRRHLVYSNVYCAYWSAWDLRTAQRVRKVNWEGYGPCRVSPRGDYISVSGYEKWGVWSLKDGRQICEESGLSVDTEWINDSTVLVGQQGCLKLADISKNPPNITYIGESSHFSCTHSHIVAIGTNTTDLLLCISSQLTFALLYLADHSYGKMLLDWEKTHCGKIDRYLEGYLMDFVDPLHSVMQSHNNSSNKRSLTVASLQSAKRRKL